MNAEFIHLLELFESRNPENIALATQLAPHFSSDFQQHFDCTIEEYLDLFLFFNEYSIFTRKIANPLEIDRFDFTKGIISYVDFSRLPKGLHALKNVKSVIFYSTTLNLFPLELCKLFNTEEILIKMKNLEVLPPEIGNFINLANFNILNTQIKSLPKEICFLSKLKILNAPQNKIDNLPSEIENLQTLEDLHLWNNQIHSLPPEIGNLKNLKYLSLENNQLISLPSEIKKLHLKTLVLSKNPLQQQTIDDLIQNSEIEAIIFNDYIFSRYEHNEVGGW